MPRAFRDSATRWGKCQQGLSSLELSNIIDVTSLDNQNLWPLQKDTNLSVIFRLLNDGALDYAPGGLISTSACQSVKELLFNGVYKEVPSDLFDTEATFNSRLHAFENDKTNPEQDRTLLLALLFLPFETLNNLSFKESIDEIISFLSEELKREIRSLSLENTFKKAIDSELPADKSKPNLNIYFESSFLTFLLYKLRQLFFPNGNSVSASPKTPLKKVEQGKKSAGKIRKDKQKEKRKGILKKIATLIDSSNESSAASKTGETEIDQVFNRLKETFSMIITKNPSASVELNPLATAIANASEEIHIAIQKEFGLSTQKISQLEKNNIELLEKVKEGENSANQSRIF